MNPVKRERTLRAVPLNPNIRTVRLWCAYDWQLRKIITFCRYRYIAEKEVRRISNTILLELKGIYAVPPRSAAARKGRRNNG